MYDMTIEDLSFSSTESGKLILEDINMKAGEGEFVCLLGRSGCGKSTFLRLLAGMEKPTAGRITLGGQALKGASLERSVVFQDYGLFPGMTAVKNIIVTLKQKFQEKQRYN